MIEKKENKCDPSCTKSIVVEVFDYDREHVVVTSRNEPGVNYIRYHYLFVKTPSLIGFGDHLIWNEAENGDWFICRGPTLKYRIHVDKFPSAVVRKLIEDRAADNPPFQPRFKI